MHEHPEPLTPPDCDLRDFPFMPLDVVRLRDSDLAATPDGEVFRAAVLSWCASWHQIPAASLPDDDAVLARLLGYGRDVKGWQKLRAAGALRGFVKCSDGRLYHPVVAEKARQAVTAKIAQRNRTEKARLARLSQSTSGGAPPLSQNKPPPVTDDVTASKGQGQGQGQGQGDKPPSLRSGGARATDPPELPDWVPKEAWGAFVENRLKIRAPLTRRGLELNLKKLARLRDQGHDPTAVLDQSVERAWRGIFALGETNGKTGASIKTEQWREGIRDFLDAGEAANHDHARASGPPNGAAGCGLSAKHRPEPDGDAVRGLFRDPAITDGG